MDNINYLIICKNGKIEIVNPFIEKDKIINVFQDNTYLKGNNYAYYITKEGDTLDLVSKSFNSTISELVADNKTIYLQEGQLLINKIN